MAVQFSVDDTSPALAYSPFPDTFSFPNLSAGWNPYFLNSGFASSIGQTGVGQTQHITSRNGASVSVIWHGTAIQLFGNTTNANFTLTLDGASVPPNQTNPSNNLLASLDGLLDANHTLRLTAVTPEVQDPPDSSMLVFDKAVITSPPPANFSDIIFTDHVLEDTDIDFSGRWSFLPSSGEPPLHQSETQGDRAQVSFSGISVRIFGTTSPQAGNYSVILDGAQSPVFSARSSFTNPNTLLFYATGLDANSTHRITILNQGGLLQLKSGGFDVFSSGEPTSLPPAESPPGTTTTTFPSPSSSSSSPSAALNENFPRGTIAALVLAGVLAFILLTAVLFFIFVWRPRRRRQRRERERELTFSPPRRKHNSRQLSGATNGFHPKEQEAGAVLDIAAADPQHDNSNITISPDGNNNGIGAIPTPANHGRRDSGKSGFARWKREIDMVSGLTGLGLKFRHSDEVEGGKAGEDHDGGDYSPRDVEQAYGGFIIEGGGPLSSGSSSRSSRRKRKSGNNGEKRRTPWAPGFPFRLSSYSRQQTTTAPAGSDDNADNRSLSGVTSLSYGSNPNLAAYLNAPPSYAASVQNSNSNSNNSNANNSPGTNSPPSVPRSVTRSPQSRSQSLPSPQDTRGPNHAREASRGLILSYAGEGNLPGEDEISPVSAPSVPPPSQRQRASGSATASGSSSHAQTHMTGMHILGIGGGLAGVGGPISMRAAIRGLSPRISKTRSQRAKEKEREREREREQEREREREREQQERERERERQRQRQRQEERERQREGGRRKRTSQRAGQRQVGEEMPLGPRSDIANVGHHQQRMGGGRNPEVASSAVPPLPPLPPLPTAAAAVPTPLPALSASARPASSESASGSGSSSPIRALPPIPVSKPARSSISPTPLPPIPPPNPQGHSPTHSNSPPSRDQGDQPATRPSVPQPKQPSRDPSGPVVPAVPPDSPSFLSIHETSPFRLEFDHGAIAAPGASTGNGGKGRGRSGPGVQSFAEAGGGIMVEGAAASAAAGEGQSEEELGASKRQSTASRVHFEDDPTSTSNTTATTPVEQPPIVAEVKPKGKGKGKAKEKAKSKFRLTPPSGQSPTSPTDVVDVGHGPTPEMGTIASFLDFSSQPPSLHSRRTSEGSAAWDQGAGGSSSGSGGQASAQNSGRIWSMQLPGRNVIPPATGLRSKWSNTTIQSGLSAHTGSGSESSPPLSLGQVGEGSPAQRSTSASVSQGSPTSNIFPFPLSIPPSPYLPEGFPGVEPSPSMFSPGASIPPPSSSLSRGHLQVPPAAAASGSSGQGQRHGHEYDDRHEQSHDHDTASHPGRTVESETVDSPTDSFPYSISEVHFRTSLSDFDSRPGVVEERDVDAGSGSGVGMSEDEDTGQLQYVRQHLYAHPPLPMSPLAPQRFNPSSTTTATTTTTTPASQSQQQLQLQQQQQPPQPNTPTSIMQRVFGSGSGGGSTPRTPRSGFLKPPS